MRAKQFGVSQEQHPPESKRNIPMQALEIPAQPDEAMRYIAPKFVRGELLMHDPVHLICLAQIIVMVVLVAGLMILEG